MYIVKYFYDEQIEREEPESLNRYERMKTIKEVKSFIKDKINMGYDYRGFDVFKSINFKVKQKITFKFA